MRKVLTLLLGLFAAAPAAAEYTMPNEVQQVHLTFTAAQIAGMFATPLVIVPAPGSNSKVVLIQGVATLNFGTTPFTGSPGTLIMGYANVPQTLTTTSSAGLLNASTTTASGLRGAIPANYTGFLNQAVVATSQTGAVSGGDSTLTIDMFYVIVPAD